MRNIFSYYALVIRIAMCYANSGGEKYEHKFD